MNKSHLEEEDGEWVLVGFFSVIYLFYFGGGGAGRLCVEENSFPSLEFWGEFLFC